MFETTKPFSSFSIKDPQQTHAFYADVLGLKVTEESMPQGEKLLTLNLDGGGKVLLYPKPDHTPATFTVLNLPVKKIHDAVHELKDRGVKFEHFEGNDADEINHNEGPLIAWFKDPSGNFLSIMELENEFSITKFFAVPKEKLFSYWTTPSLVEKWAYPNGMTLKVPLLETRLGGRYRYEHTSVEGVWVATGEFQEYILNQKVVQLDNIYNPKGELVYKDLEGICEFRDVENGSEVTITQRGFTDQAGLKACQEGWDQSLKHLNSLFHL